MNHTSKTPKKRVGVKLPENSFQALQVEKEVYDYLKPFLKPDVKPEDLSLIWNLPLYQAMKLNALANCINLTTNRLKVDAS